MLGTILTESPITPGSPEQDQHVPILLHVALECAKQGSDIVSGLCGIFSFRNIEGRLRRWPSESRVCCASMKIRVWISRTYVKVGCSGVHLWEWSAGTGRSWGAPWLASLPKTTSSRFNERSHLRMSTQTTNKKQRSLKQEI